MLEHNKTSIAIYSKPGCTYCDKAKAFFEEINVPFEVVMLNPEKDDYQEKATWLKTSTGQNTFPFVFVGEEFVGGFMELVRAHRTLKLHDLCSKIGITVEYDF